MKIFDHNNIFTGFTLVKLKNKVKLLKKKQVNQYDYITGTFHSPAITGY